MLAKGDVKETHKEEMRGIGLEDGCRNCQGREASAAWDAFGLLRAENRGLKNRLGIWRTRLMGRWIWLLG
jgi:hypothetical protein